MSSNRDKTLIIDGNNILHRNYHALLRSNLTSHEGEPIWAVVGSLSTIFNYDKIFHPDRLIICFDSPGGSKARKRIYKDYKANRGESSDVLNRQLYRLFIILNEMGLPNIAMDGEEADDLIASTHRLAKNSSDEIFLSSSDRDLYQLLDANTKIISNNNQLIDSNFVFEKYGIHSHQYRLLSALRGEDSDNIVGVPGIGVKKASYLINKYSDLESMLKSNDSKDEKLIQLLHEYKERIELNMKINLLKDDLLVDNVFSASNSWRNDDGILNVLAKNKFDSLYKSYKNNIFKY